MDCDTVSSPSRDGARDPPSLGLNLDPLIPGAGISHGLDDAHISDPSLEIGLGLDPSLRFHGGNEVIFDVPAALELRRYFHHVQSPIAGTSGVDGVGTEIVGHGPGF